MSRVLKKKNAKRLRLKSDILFLRNEFFENFRGPFYDDIIYKDNSYL